MTDAPTATQQNLEYARQLVHKLESQASSTSVNTTKRQKLQTDLAAYKQTIRRLNEALHAASTSIVGVGLKAWVGDAGDEGYDSASGDETDARTNGEAEKTADEVDDYARLNRPTANRHESLTQLPTTASKPPAPVPTAPPAESGSTLRNRFPGRQTDHQKRAALFGSAATKPVTNQGTEALLDHQRREQEDITEDLVKMAQMLKASSLEFGKSLEDEKGFLDQAKEGLDRNAAGMESAGRRIENLRKNETVSWYWSIIYMVSIVVLAFFTLFILFFAPKLRWW